MDVRKNSPATMILVASTPFAAAAAGPCWRKSDKDKLEAIICLFSSKFK